MWKWIRHLLDLRLFTYKCRVSLFKVDEMAVMVGTLGTGINIHQLILNINGVIDTT
jgi:hypothetical protein